MSQRPAPAPPAERQAKADDSVVFSVSDLRAVAASSFSSAPRPPAETNAARGSREADNTGIVNIGALLSANKKVEEARAEPAAAAPAPSLPPAPMQQTTDAFAMNAAAQSWDEDDLPSVAGVHGKGRLAMSVAVVALVVLGGILGVRSLNKGAGTETPAVVATAVTTPVSTPAPAAQDSQAHNGVPRLQASAFAPRLSARAARSAPRAERRAGRRHARQQARPRNARARRRVASGARKEAAVRQPTAKPVSSDKASMDSLLEGALTGRTSKRASSSDDLPRTPSRGATKAAFGKLSNAVHTCAGGRSGVAPVRVTVSGATGRATRAQVMGTYSSGPVGACVKRIVMTRLSLPKFSRPTLQVTYPFKL